MTTHSTTPSLGAKCYGLAFGLSTMLLAAACSPGDIATTPSGCLPLAAATSIGSIVDAPRERTPRKNSFAFFLAEERKGMGQDERHDFGRRLTAISRAISHSTQAKGLSDTDAQLDLRVNMLLMAEEHQDVAAKGRYGRLLDSLRAVPGTAAALEAARSDLVRIEAYREFQRSSKGAASLVNTANDTIVTAAGILSIGDAVADSALEAFDAFSNAHGTLSSVIGSLSSGSTFTTGLNDTNDMLDTIRVGLEPAIFQAYADGQVPQYRFTAECAGKSGSVSPQDMKWCPWCLGLGWAVVRRVADYVARKVVNAKTVSIMEIETVVEEGLTFFGIEVSETVLGFIVDAVVAILIFDVQEDHTVTVHR